HRKVTGNKDSLDFILESEYNHHKHFLKNKNEICLQRRTLDITDGNTSDQLDKAFKNSNVKILAPNHPLRIICSANKRSPHSSKTVISSHHTQTTNNGFARKPDGGFYNS
ncbi:hypothetical protein HELRODRAFT_89338, partial [Helobdella robusta]|uniref:Uncharacterized protein n=1 Tax=Helobdella robusta TaxID=6412 RepID=T1G7C4_HELRO